MKRLLLVFVILLAFSSFAYAAGEQNFGQWSQLDLMAQRVAYDDDGNVQYIGYALAGALDSQAKWMICKLAYDESGQFVSRTWASGSDQRNQIWNNRAALTYR